MNVNVKGLTELDEIHRRRMGHAQYGLFLDLLSLDIPVVDAVLADWGITLLPFRRVGIEYASGRKQILEAELKAAKKPKKAGKKKK